MYQFLIIAYLFTLHPCSLISVYIVHTKHSIIPKIAIAEISRPLLASLAELASLSQAWSYTPKAGSLMTAICSKKFDTWLECIHSVFTMVGDVGEIHQKFDRTQTQGLILRCHSGKFLKKNIESHPMDFGIGCGEFDGKFAKLSI